MAEESLHVPRASPQVPVSCEMCEGYENVSWYCLQCPGNLCTSCKEGHSVPIFRKHKIVPIFEGLQQRVSEQEECRSHPAFVYIMYCNDCRKLVCKRCVTTQEHKGHKLSEIEEAMRKVHKEIKEYSDLLKTGILHHCDIQKEELTQRILNCKQKYNLVEYEINKRTEEVKKKIESERDKLLKEALTKKEKYIATMEQADQRLVGTISEVQGLISSSEEIPRKSDAENIAFNNNKFIPTLTELTNVFDLHLSFLPGKSDDKIMAKMIGTLNHEQSCRVKSIKRHKYGIHISKVITVNTCESWIGSHDLQSLKLVNMEGQVLKTMKKPFKMKDFAITPHGNIIATDYYERSIKYLEKPWLKFVPPISTEPNFPSGICVAADTGYIVVCVNNVDNSGNSLEVYKSNGILMQRMKYTSKPVGDKMRQYVTQIQNGDYCIAHRGHRTVYVLDKGGLVRFTYDGSGAEKLKQKFYPYSVCGDPNGHLIISDRWNHALHVIDQKGNFMQYLLTESNKIHQPMGLCLDEEGKLWVGQQNGELCVVRYT